MTSMLALWGTIDRWLAAGESVAIATVVDTKRSAPQPPGTKMAVGGAGHISGAVSGGCVEGAVVEEAERIIAGEDPKLLTYGIADEDAWEVGLPCGGEISVWVERFEPGTLQSRFSELALAGRRAALVTALTPKHGLGAKLLVEDGAEIAGSLGDPDLDAKVAARARDALWSEDSGMLTIGETTVFIDVTAPRPRLIIVGAVDFAAQLSTVAAVSGWRAFVIDPRARFATPERFPSAERVIAAWPGPAIAELEPLDPATAVAVLTHDPKLDDDALTAALSSNAGYIGAMGSRRAQARRRERLLEAGVTAEQLERISAPIGLDLGARTSADTALSIMAEIVAARHGRAGGRLADSSGRIHDAVAS